MSSSDVIYQGKSDFLAGVGGWAYLPVKRGNKLEICSRLYDYAEVNSTFYALPEIDRAKKWRETVSDRFEFTLRANKELTHVGHLKPTAKNLRVYEKMVELAKVLDATILHFQFPAYLVVDRDMVKGWRDFFASTLSRGQSRSRLKFAIEVRNQERASSAEFARLIQDYDIIPAYDLSREEPAYASVDSKILYTRVFGSGKHTKWVFDSQELKALASKVTKTDARKKYVTFHNLTMYEDASRMRTIVRTGKDQKLPASAPLGLHSLEQVLSSGRVKYPATKQELINEFGWRVFDLDPETRLHVEHELEKLSDRDLYESVEHAIQTIAQAQKS